MDPAVISSSFALLFLAELGDKTQLMAISLAQRFSPWPVLAGTLAAFAVLNLLAVVFGAALYRLLPEWLVLLTAGSLFLFFAWKSWRDADSEEAEVARGSGMRSALVTSFALIFVAELGDKTQLALVGLVAGTGAPWSAFTGATLALWSISIIAIMIGQGLRRRLPHRLLQRVAALLFALFGLLALGRVGWQLWQVGGA